MKYVLEIYNPEEKDCVSGLHKSNSPFMIINEGDFIHSATLNLDENSLHVRAASVEHIIYDVDGKTTHKVCVHTNLAKVTPMDYSVNNN